MVLVLVAEIAYVTSALSEDVLGFGRIMINKHEHFFDCVCLYQSQSALS